MAKGLEPAAMACFPPLSAPAHALLGSKDTDGHNDQRREAAGTNAGQHHNEGDEGFPTEAKSAVTAGLSCGDTAIKPGAVSRCWGTSRSALPLQLPGDMGTALPGKVQGSGATPAAGMSKDKHIRPRGLPAKQESGWGQGTMSSPAPHTDLDGTRREVLTSQWGWGGWGWGHGAHGWLNFPRAWALEFEEPWVGNLS